MLKRLIKVRLIDLLQRMSKSTANPAQAEKKTRTRNPIKIYYEESSDSDAPKKKISKLKKVPKEEPKQEPQVLKDAKVGIDKETQTTEKTKKSRKKPSAKSSDVGENKYDPPHWKELIENMREHRKSHPAPVDTMGCSSCHDESASEKTQRFQKLVALMLSSQTKDETTFAACQRLKKFGFTPEFLVKAETGDLEEVLKPVSFYKTKAKHIQKTCEILINDYNSDIPNTVQGLMKLPGVGAKMAHICMKSAWNIISGIGVDTHVHRISNRWNFVPKPTKKPEDTRVALEDWLPREFWDEVNLLMVGFGQTVCLPLRPKCGECLNKEICPAAFKESGSPKKKSKE